jgi:hypothetical protein
MNYSALISPVKTAKRICALFSITPAGVVDDSRHYCTRYYARRRETELFMEMFPFSRSILSAHSTWRSKPGPGIAFLHSHPLGSNWQGLSLDDKSAESGIAGAVMAATGFPLVGLTLACGDDFWSARRWVREGPRAWREIDAESVRVVGSKLEISHFKGARPLIPQSIKTRRTVSAWGDTFHQQLVRLRIGVVGLGSVGSVVVEALARMGCSNLVVIDGDTVEEVNLDRILNAHAGYADKGLPKATLAAVSSTRAATSPEFNVEPVCAWLQEERAFRAALDCDVLFSCVDKPWARSILNNIAFTHLIPVIDGGVCVRTKANGALRSAEWGAFVVTPGRRCLCCLGQYDPGLVAVQRAGHLDDPSYLDSLPRDSSLLQRENVILFALNVASMQVLRLVQLMGGAAGTNAPGELRYSFPADHVQCDSRICVDGCDFPKHIAEGDSGPHPGTAQ